MSVIDVVAFVVRPAHTAKLPLRQPIGGYLVIEVGGMA